MKRGPSCANVVSCKHRHDTKGPAMNVPQDVLEHKTLMIALLACAGEVARELGVDVSLPVAAMSRTLGANRTSVYEQKDRLVRALTALVQSGPGRPAAESDAPRPCSCQETALTVRVQEFRIRHLDAVVEHANRTSYSPSFRRFILEQLDGWEGTTASFAEACRVPPDTLKDWARDDRAGLPSTPPAKRRLELPVDASETTRSIAQDFEEWEGTTKDFLRLAGQRYGLTANQVARVLRICGAIASRSRRQFRHRGTTERLSPGALLVTDGKTLDVELTGSGSRIRKNWQGIVDQATGCDTAAVVTEEEDAAAARSAFEKSVEFLGDVPPEGAFSLFEARVGTIRLDDSSMASLIASAVGEIVRAYTAATNGVPRAELEGLSRQAALRFARPSSAQQAADRAFIRDLKERHERERHSNWREKIKPVSRRLLGHVFATLELGDRDPLGKLQEYLSIYEPAAIRQAAVIVAARLGRGELQRTHAHRYLAKVIQTTQESLDLERQAAELFELCRLQAQDWVSMERVEYEQLQRDNDPRTLACALAERAAWGGLPVQGAFWTEQLLELLDRARHLVEPVSRFLVRLYEAPVERRLLLLDRIAALQW